MECRNKPVIPARKLVQARLPFKRLNVVPKEKYDTGMEIKKAKTSQDVLGQNKDSNLESASLDNTENGYQLDSQMQFTPKLVNGKGPLDIFVQKNLKNNTRKTVLIFDLTEDSNHAQNDGIDSSKLNSEASSSVETTNGLTDTSQSSPLKPVQNAQVAVSVDATPPYQAAANKDEDLIDLTKSCSELSNVQCNLENKRANQSELKGVIFEGKMPVVVLEDIMTTKSPQVAFLEESVTSESETIESSPEGDSVCINSSFSSSSSTSSPETQPALKNRSDTSPLAASTAVRKDQERADKLQKLQAEKEERGRLKEEAKAAKERAKEEARKKKEEEKELKEKERREKKEKDEKEKAEKLRVKEEKRKERQERINAQKAEITRFFQKPKTPQAPKTLAGSCGKFAPFEIKENMVLAPLYRVAFDQELSDQLDQFLEAQRNDVSFLEELKCRKPHKSGATIVCYRSADMVNSDVVIVNSCKTDSVPERKKFGRMKLLQFCENHRPAYWGTWNKKTTVIHPRNPWSKDNVSISQSVWHFPLCLEEGGEDEDDDDGFFVPHGYLSEDEGVTEEHDPENQKVRQKLKAKEWDELIAKGKRFHVLQAVKIGCIWETEESNSNTDADLKVLQQFAVCILDSSVAEDEQMQKISKKRTKDQQILGQLLPLLHGNVHGSKVIIHEFQEGCRQGLFSETAPDTGDASPTGPNVSRPHTPVNEDFAIPSKARLKRIISENSVYEKRPEYRMCWYVHSEVLKSFDQEHLPVPCQWNYITPIPSAVKEDNGSVPGMAVIQTTPVSTKKKPTGSMSITKFMKKPRDAQQVSSFKNIPLLWTEKEMQTLHVE
uniref:Chromatin assembly factor 1 subunit A n=1 Tax=Pelusios castaneus TaxID=367368 RepID=A0A8C8RY14_9SAUR